jgi:glyoxylase-like metal-dependent hydrolase (beta-lactamase superfamily II)
MMLKWRLGDIAIERIVESEVADFEPLSFFPQTVAEDWAEHRAWMQPRAMDPASGKLVLCIQSFLLRTRHHTILVDTCVGDHKSRSPKIYPSSWNMTSGEVWLRRLAAAGVRPEGVDYVMCTHLHADHVGWNTRLVDGRWVPTFPKARYIMSRLELEHRQQDLRPKLRESFVDSVLPVVEAGQAQLVSSDFALDDQVWLEPTPGHTPDHFSVRLRSGGSDAVITGDLMHSPVQCRRPEWNSIADFDFDQARRTRRAFLAHCCERSTLVCASHFPSPSFGRVLARGDSFDFSYATGA